MSELPEYLAMQTGKWTGGEAWQIYKRDPNGDILPDKLSYVNFTPLTIYKSEAYALEAIAKL